MPKIRHQKKYKFRGGAGKEAKQNVKQKMIGTGGPVKSKSTEEKESGIWTTWIEIKQWLELSQVFILIGIVIFTISQSTGGGDLAAYIWFTFGVLATWILTMRLLSVAQNPNKTSIWDAFKHMPILFPTLATLLPLIILIYIFSSLKTVLEENMEHLPNQFFWFNRFTFFLIVLQLFFLNKYYSMSVGSLLARTRGDEQTNTNRSIWIAALILISILSSAAAIELYVIITAFVTDG